MTNGSSIGRMRLEPMISRRTFALAAAGLAVASWAPQTAAQTPIQMETADLADRLTPLIELAPTYLPSVGNPAPPFYYADLQAQLASVGIDQFDPDSAETEFPDGFREALLGLPLAATAYQVGLVPEWLPTFGFAPFSVHQALTLNASPDAVTMFSGGLDPERVRTALTASGFEQADEEEDAQVYSYPDAADPGSVVFQLGLGTMGHAVLVDDTVVFSQQKSGARRVARVSAGMEPSMAEKEPWTELLPTFSSDIVGLIPLYPEAMMVPGQQPAATPVARASSGGLQYLAFGIRAGSMNAPLSLVGEGTPEATPADGFQAEPATIEARLRYGSSEQAAQQAEAIPEAWKAGRSALTGEAFDEILTLQSSSVSGADDRMVSLDFVTVDSVNSWIQLIQGRDLSPFLPIEG